MYRFITILCAILFFFSAVSAMADQEEGISGKVIRTMSTPEYTYILLQNKESRQWIAIPATAITDGSNITVAPGMTMENFYSKTFEKTFERIIFSAGLLSGIPTGAVSQNPADIDFNTAVEQERRAESEARQKDNPATQQAQSFGSAGAAVPDLEVNIEKASAKNAVTIQEAFEKADELQKKKVQIHAKVVKINANIMGRNWIHIQDGTGSSMKGSHDLVVTSGDSAAVGDIILIEGIVTTNRDFGHGYTYRVLIEEAAILETDRR